MSKLSFLLGAAFFSCYAVSLLVAQSKVEQSEDGSSGTISFSTPDLSDDDAHSPWVPDQMKCDACRAVSYQVCTVCLLYFKFKLFELLVV